MSTLITLPLRSNTESRKVDAVLFDLDGTLLDTAGDLGGALNAILIEDQRDPLSQQIIRPHVSKGGMALVELGYGVDRNSAAAHALWQRLLDYYRAHLVVHTVYFNGINWLIDAIEASHRSWGVVTNKPSDLTLSLAQQIGLTARTHCIVSGDTLSEKKPSPAPLLYACQLLKVDPAKTIYVGDHRRDIEAGLNAGMLTLVSAYGYIAADENLTDWGAHGIVQSPRQIYDWID